MPDLLVSAAVDVPQLEASFRRAAQTAQTFAADVSRLNVALPTPQVDVAAVRAQGVATGAAYSAGLSETIQAGLPATARQVEATLADLRANLAGLSATAGELRIGTVHEADVEALRQLVVEQRALAEATSGAQTQVRALDRALQTLNESEGADAASLRTVETLLGDVAAAAERLKAGGPIGVTISTNTLGEAAAQQAAQAAEQQVAAVQRGAAAEIAARREAAAEITKSIPTLALYGRTLDVTNARAVAAWREEASAIRAQATDLGLPREAMLRLDAVVQQTQARFARLQEAAARVAIPTPQIGLGNLPALTTDTGAFTRAGRTGANAALAFGFALESLATGSTTAEGKLKTALHAVSAFGLALGPEGLWVSAIAQSAVALIDLAKRTNVAEAAVRSYTATLGDTAKAAGDATAAVLNLTQAQSAQRQLTLTDNLRQAREEATKLRAALAAKFDATGSFTNVTDLFKSNDFRELRNLTQQQQDDFAKGRISAEQYSEAIARVGLEYPALVPVSRTLVDQLNPLIDLERAAKGYATALGGVAAATHVAGTPFQSGLEQQIADARELARAEREGGIVAKDSFAIAQRAFNEWRTAQHGGVVETLTLSQALKSSDADIRGHADAFVRDGRILAQYTEGVKGAREALTAAERAMAQFRARAEASTIRLDLAIKLAVPPEKLAPMLDDLRQQYEAVAAAAAVPRTGKNAETDTLAFLREQLDLLNKIETVIRDTATTAATRVTLAPVLGFDAAAQARQIGALRDHYADVVTEIARQGGPQRASVELLQQQIRLAEQLGGEFARLLAAPAPTVAQLVQPIDPAIRADLLAVRAALDDVAAARARVQLDKLTPPTLGHVAQFSADLATLEGAANSATAAQARLTAAMRTQGLSTLEQQRDLATLDAAYQAAGLSVDELATRVLNLARAGIARLALPTIHVPDLPVVPLAIVPRLEQVHITPQDLEHAVGGPLTATVHLRYVNAAFVDPTLQASIQRQIDAVQVAVTAANAAKTNLEIKVAAKVDHASIADAKREYDALARAAKDATRDAQRSIAGLGAGEQQTTAAKDLDTAIGSTQVKAHHLTEEFIAGARALNEGLQAAGLLDAKTANIANSAITFAESLSKALASKGADVGSDISALLAGFNLVKGIFGKSEIDKEHDRILLQNNEQLARLRADLSGFTRTAAGLDAARRAVASDTLIEQARNGGLSGLFGGTHPVLDETALQRFGLTIGDLTTLAQSYGITLLDSKNRIIPESLTKLGDAVDIATRKLFTWASTLTDLTDQRALANDVFDFTQTDTAAQGMQRALDDSADILQRIAPDLYHKIFDGLDAHTAAGRTLLNTRLSDIMTEELSDEFKQGKGWLAELLRKSGFESLADFNKWLLTTDHALDDFTKTTLDATQALGNVPAAFKTLLDRTRFEVQQPLALPTPTPTPRSPSVPLTPPTSPTTGGPTYVIYAPQFGDGAIVVRTEEDAATVLHKVNTAVIAEARGAEGIHHPAAQGLMVALARLPRKS